MRNATAVLVAGLAVVSGARAQYPGAPLLDTAGPGQNRAAYGWAAASAAFDGSGYVGARGGYRATEDLLLFADAGYTEALTHGLSIVPTDVAATIAQAGAAWTLPLRLPFRLAARACAFKAFVPPKTHALSVQNSAMIDAALSMNASGAAAQLVGGREAAEGLRIYGGLGVHFLIAEASLDYTIRPVFADRPAPVQPGGTRHQRASELDLGLAGGLAYRVARNVDAMAELSYLKGPAVAAGFRAAF
ncbi:MAG: hypothetical protein FJ225_08280 [Lentisphaerae bacterium]|nr:hypothetical protein [Lentisphaerota bacterium]